MFKIEVASTLFVTGHSLCMSLSQLSDSDWCKQYICLGDTKLVCLAAAFLSHPLTSIMNKSQLISPYISSSDSASDSSDKENSPQNLQPKRKRQKRVGWNLEQRFANRQEAVHFIDQEKTWSTSYSNSTTEGKKVYYRCKRVKRRGVQCAASIHLLYINTSLEVELFRSESEHTCHSLSQSSQRLSDEMKKEMDSLLELKQKPKRIFELLHDKGFKPTMNQVSNYAAQWRKLRFGPSSISLGELEQWCEEKESVPDNDDQAFVVSYLV